jgi:hypothetical protein
VVPECYQGGNRVHEAILSIANAYAARAFGVSGRSGQSALVVVWIVGKWKNGEPQGFLAA